MGASFRLSHRLAGATEEGMVKEHRGDTQFDGIEFGEDRVRVICTIVVANASMVTTNDKMGAAVVFAHQRVKDRFARPCVAHGGWQDAEQHSLDRIVVFQEDFVAAHTHVGRNIIALGIADQRMKIQAIDRLQRALLDILVSAVDGVARLKTNYPSPAPFRETLARLLWSIAILRKDLLLQSKYAHRAAQEHLALLVQHPYPRMSLFERAVYVAGL